jgi:hypothetical protein
MRGMYGRKGVSFWSIGLLLGDVRIYLILLDIFDGGISLSQRVAFRLVGGRKRND